MADEQSAESQPAGTPEGDSQRARNRRSGQRRGPRAEDSVEERRGRPRNNDRSGANGFRDGVDHALCAAMNFTPSPSGVIYARTGVATMTNAVIARRQGAILQCDLQHAGPHVWPDGEVATTEGADQPD